ncbi:MAG: non-canonical purine NTP pyrophosphatase [Phycisphaerales bacterium]
MADLPSIVLATANPHKVEELGALLRGVALLVPLPAGLSEPEETGTTFEENASIKALAYATLTGRACLADDSGLEIDALGGRPGVISSHYCSDGAATPLSREDRDVANCVRVMGELLGVPAALRTARFVCVMALAEPPRGESAARISTVVRGTFEGRIGVETQVPRGENGFGYDPLFLVGPEFRLTSAELAPAEKNRLSHRAQAAELLRARLGGSGGGLA